jgi:lipoprotein-anchoring transpeptidase ErfK/SrfK
MGLPAVRCFITRRRPRRRWPSIAAAGSRAAEAHGDAPLRCRPGSDIVGYVQKDRRRQGRHPARHRAALRCGLRGDIDSPIPASIPGCPGVGREVVVPTQFILPAAPHEGVVVNVAAMRIFYYPPHKKGEPQMVYTHPIGIGKVGWKTPEGTTKIVSRTRRIRCGWCRSRCATNMLRMVRSCRPGARGPGQSARRSICFG